MDAESHQLDFTSTSHLYFGGQIMRRHLPTVVRVLLGLTFFVFGLNGFLHFLPQPPLEGSSAAFVGGLASASYFFPLLKGTEVLAGLALLSGRYVPLALTVLAPVIVNIAMFHLFLAPGVGMVVFLVGAESFLAWSYRDAFRGVLDSNARPATDRVHARLVTSPAE
jgi:uncharacterized membrane protein YphA (DoxX/SURF4 family)